MKKLLIATAVAMTFSMTAQAANENTAQLKVIGTLTNDACTPEMTGGGTVDFGTHYVDTLSATDTNQLGKKDLTLTINCQSPTKVGWTIQDNTVNEAASITIVNPGWSEGDDVWDSKGRFGVGKTAGGVNIGAYAVTLNQNGATADGKAATLVEGGMSGEQVVWTHFNAGSDYDNVTNDGATAITLTTDTNDYLPTAFTTGVFPMRVGLAVQKTSTLAITDNTPIVGLATITLRYL